VLSFYTSGRRARGSIGTSKNLRRANRDDVRQEHRIRSHTKKQPENDNECAMQ
jgi:hypothetical protein